MNLHASHLVAECSRHARVAALIGIGMVAAVGLTGCQTINSNPPEMADQVQRMLPQISDQPWAGPSERAFLDSDRPRFDFGSTAFDATWTWDDGKRFADPFQIARRIDRSIGRRPTIIEDEDGRRYAYDETCTIVCVNPVIVLIEPKPIDTDDLAGSVTRSPLERLINIGPGTVTLPNAYRAGTTLSSIDGVRYFVAGTSDEPKPLEADEDGVASIDVPWGHLEVRPDFFNGYRIKPVAAE